MRQAGRYLPEYRRIRQRHDVLTICRTPRLASEVTLAPVDRLGVDAAVIFADIMLPLEGAGIAFTIQDEVGPVVAKPLRSPDQVARLRTLDAARDVPFVLEAIRRVRTRLHGKVPVIGFAGAPFTLAAYLIEGGPSRDFVETKRFMYRQPAAWKDLLERLAQSMVAYLRAQVQAGAQALQLFDSWAGVLSPADYRAFVLPQMQRLFRDLRDLDVPLIHFGTGTATLLSLMREAGGDVIGIDWRISLDEAWTRIGSDCAIQGNLDPAALLAPAPLMQRRARDVLARAGGRPGHIFNLGHGVLPHTIVSNVQRLVRLVHADGGHAT
jgi:uroporphyrinogen decarboxylase